MRPIYISCSGLHARYRHNLSGMDFRHLQTSVTVAEHGTVTRRRRVHLGIAQPALSRQIKNLEDGLRIRLFDRIRRRLVLTSEGEQLLADCRPTSSAPSERAEGAGAPAAAARRRRPEGGGHAADDRRCPVRLPRPLRQASAQRGGQAERGDGRRAACDARRRRGSCRWSRPPGRFRPIHPSARYLAALAGIRRGPNPRAGLPPSGAAAAWTFATLGTHPLLLMDQRASRSAPTFDAACRVAEFKPRVKFESRTPHTFLALAEAGHGVAIVPSVLPTHRYKLQVRRADVPQQTASRGVRPCFRRSSALARPLRTSLPMRWRPM